MTLGLAFLAHQLSLATMSRINESVLILFILFAYASASVLDEEAPSCGFPELTEEQQRNIKQRVTSLNILGPIAKDNIAALKVAGLAEPITTLTDEQKQIFRRCRGFGMLSEPKKGATPQRVVDDGCCSQPTTFVVLAASIDSNGVPVELVQLEDLVQEFGDTNHCPHSTCMDRCAPIQLEFPALVITLPEDGPFGFAITKIKVDVCGAVPQ